MRDVGETLKLGFDLLRAIPGLIIVLVALFFIYLGSWIGGPFVQEGVDTMFKKQKETK